MQHHDHEYYSKRAREERDRADRAPESTARRIHQEMAERYASMIGETIEAQPRVGA